MAKKITVTTQTLRTKKENLVSKNNLLKKKIDRLEEVEGKLKGQWDGEANDKFHAAFNSDKAQMDKFHAAIQKYCTSLEQIIKQYENAERANTQIASKRTYH